MKFDEFQKNLHAAVTEAVTGAEKIIIERLPAYYVFCTHRSDNAHVGTYTEEQLAQTLYHESGMPRWINLYVSDASETMTVLRCEYSDETSTGRTTYAGLAEGYAPFHVLVPTPPPNLRELLTQESDGKPASYDSFVTFYAAHRFSIKQSGSYHPAE